MPCQCVTSISELIGGWSGFAFFSFGSVGALIFRLLSNDKPTDDSDTTRSE